MKLSVLFILSLFTSSLYSLGSYDPSYEDYILVNNYDVTIIIKATSTSGHEFKQLLEPEQGRVLILPDGIIRTNDILTADDLYSYYDSFILYDEYGNIIRDTIFYSYEIELINEEYDYYYNINLGEKLNNP